MAITVNSHDELDLRRLELKDFADLFGTTVEDMPDECSELIAKHDFRYRVLDGSDRDRTLLGVLKRIDSGELSTAGQEAKPRWEKGWGENLKEFRDQGGDLSKLVPRYIRPDQPLRLYQNYVKPVDSDFEFNWYEIFRQWIFQTYLRDFDTIYEFGSGSGFNLSVLAQLYPEKRLYGLDWVAASRDIVNEMASTFGWNMQGILFDFFSPDERVSLEANSAVLTIGALEQTGQNYDQFLAFLLRRRPKICVHVEPILEWYEEDNLIDYAAIRFHRRRGYWQGFPAHLKELERTGAVEIIKQKRAYFGSLFLEGYSQIIWRPLP